MTEQEVDRCEFWVSANRRVRESKEPNFSGEKIQVNFEWNLQQLETWLEDYHDKQVVEFLKYGWPLNAKNTEINTEIPRNQKGVEESPNAVRKYIQQELQRGTIIGPFLCNPFGKLARFSPLDAIPKKDSEEKRVILNLSHLF